MVYDRENVPNVDSLAFNYLLFKLSEADHCAKRFLFYRSIEMNIGMHALHMLKLERIPDVPTNRQI